MSHLYGPRRALLPRMGGCCTERRLQDSANKGFGVVSGLCGTGYGLGRDLDFSLIALTALESACLIFFYRRQNCQQLN